uniref:Uncharacterized protein n=1 Tax=Rhizophora mucronata TaxID=61149 RepID=A0A2P2NLU3_RHIMU
MIICNEFLCTKIALNKQAVIIQQWK